jgi:uncharacterized protein (TIGR00299 family) protein
VKPSRIALLDLFSGISGDMLLGALLDLGADLDSILDALKSLNLPGLDIRREQLVKKGITCTKATVMVKEDEHPHRHLSHVEAAIRGGALPVEIVDGAIAVFRRIGEAEAKIHGKPVEKIHFHEVGALDAVVDVTACLLAVRDLGIERFYAGSVAVGTGTIEGSHGTLPVPCPASVEILGDFPVEPTGIRQELVTPTGAALLRHLVPAPGWPASLRIERAGYGAGTREVPGRANVVRILMGSSGEAGADLVSVVETNIDDMNPEIYGYLIEHLLGAGALDAFLTPLIGKKNRPAVQVTVLCSLELEPAMADILLRETTSLGVRISRSLRTCIRRERRMVQTRWGAVHVKIGQHGALTKAAPEYEDCRRIAEEHHVSLLEVYEEVRRVHGG